VLVAALFSPPDSLTFVLYAGLLLAGYGVGTVVATDQP
jgi:Sec-independent protein secretion pathway component TatC